MDTPALCLKTYIESEYDEFREHYMKTVNTANPNDPEDVIAVVDSILGEMPAKINAAEDVWRTAMVSAVAYQYLNHKVLLTKREMFPYMFGE